MRRARKRPPKRARCTWSARARRGRLSLAIDLRLSRDGGRGTVSLARRRLRSDPPRRQRLCQRQPRLLQAPGSDARRPAQAAAGHVAEGLGQQGPARRARRLHRPARRADSDPLDAGIPRPPAPRRRSTARRRSRSRRRRKSTKASSTSPRPASPTRSRWSRPKARPRTNAKAGGRRSRNGIGR